MKFGGTFQQNWSNAVGSKSDELKREVILDEVGRLIETNRPSVISALNESGYKVKPSISKKELINKTVSALYRSKQFQSDVAKNILAENSFSGVDASQAQNTLKGVASGAGSGASGGVVGSIAGAIGSIFQFGASRQQAKAEEERTKQELYNKLLTEKEQTNWMPIIVVGGVLIIGGIIAFFALRNKN